MSLEQKQCFILSFSPGLDNQVNYIHRGLRDGSLHALCSMVLVKKSSNTKGYQEKNQVSLLSFPLNLPVPVRGIHGTLTCACLDDFMHRVSLERQYIQIIHFKVLGADKCFLKMVTSVYGGNYSASQKYFIFVCLSLTILPLILGCSLYFLFYVLSAHVFWHALCFYWSCSL